MELSVTDWTFPITPESGATAFTWAATGFGIVCAASKETNTMRNRGRIMKAFFQPPVMLTLVGYNTFLKVMRSLLNEFQYTNEQTRSVEVSCRDEGIVATLILISQTNCSFPGVRRVEKDANQLHGVRRTVYHQPMPGASTAHLANGARHVAGVPRLERTKRLVSPYG